MPLRPYQPSQPDTLTDTLTDGLTGTRARRVDAIASNLR